MSSQQNDKQRLIKKYQDDIASVEEKEEYLTRNIQVMENLIPTVMVWYMWKVTQTRKLGTFSQSSSEEDAKKQLLHLERILEELQEADYILKEEEQAMRSRIEKLESSVREEVDEPFPRPKEINNNELTTEHKRNKALEENKVQFEDILEDPTTDWQNKCKELCEKVNTLTETLQETNNTLKNKDGYIKQLQDNLSGKGKDVFEKIEDLETQNKAFFSEVFDHEKERDAEDAYLNKKLYSAVQEAMEEVETIKTSLIMKTPTREEENNKKESKNKFSPQHHSIIKEVEEETKSDLLDRGSPDCSYPPSEFYQKPLVSAPDEVLPGSKSSAPIPRATIPPLPQIFESLESVKASPGPYSKVKLRTTATGTIVSIPPDVSEVLSMKPEDVLSDARPSLSKAEPVLSDFQTSQLEQPLALDIAARRPEPTVPTSTISEYGVDRQVPPTESYISGIITNVPDPTISKEPVTKVPKTPAEVFPIADTSSTKSLEERVLSSTKAEVLGELLHPEPESPLAPKIKLEIPEALKDRPYVEIKVPPSGQGLFEKSSIIAEHTFLSQSSQSARYSKVTEVLADDASLLELNTIFADHNSKSAPEKPKLTSVATSEQIPSTSKAAADMSEAQAIMSEPYENSFTDGVQPTPSGLAFQKEVGTLYLRPSVDSLTGQTLQSKCRVKDHLIKNMADHLKDLAKKNVWSGNKLFKDISSDPVKTYDFDRTTLYKYIKGQEPQDLAPLLKSNESYSTTNPLKVRLGRKVDNDSLLLEWGPPPSQEVLGFQIFINGEFKYWVHSAKRSKALLHPVDLATKMDIIVSPVNATGDIVHRSYITYNP